MNDALVWHSLVWSFFSLQARNFMFFKYFFKKENQMGLKNSLKLSCWKCKMQSIKMFGFPIEIRLSFKPWNLSKTEIQYIHVPCRSKLRNKRKSFWKCVIIVCTEILRLILAFSYETNRLVHNDNELKKQGKKIHFLGGKARFFHKS